MDNVSEKPPIGTAECAETTNEKAQNGVPAELHVDPEEEKALVKKLDRVIMPIMAFVYFFQCMSSMICL